MLCTHWIRYYIFKCLVWYLCSFFFIYYFVTFLKVTEKHSWCLIWKTKRPLQRSRPLTAMLKCQTAVGDPQSFHLARLCLACSDWWDNSLRQWEFRYRPVLLCLSRLFEKPHTACCIICAEINSLDLHLKHPIIPLHSFIVLRTVL